MIQLMKRNQKTQFNYLSKIRFSNLLNNYIPEDKNLAYPLSISRPDYVNKVFNTNTKISKLKTGLTVATQNQFGLQCTIGVMLKCAPRYEVHHISGISHFIEKLGFQSTEKYKSKDEVQRVLDQCGAISDIQLARDLLIYGVSGKTTEMEKLVHLLSEIILKPQITKDEVEVARQAVSYENQAMRIIPPPDNMMQDLIHQAAFRNNTLGLPRYCPMENINTIQRSDIITLMAMNFRPDSMVLVGVGVDHDDMVNSAKKHFFPYSDFYLKDSDIRNNILSFGPDKSTAQMTGGEVRLMQDLSQYHSPMPEFAHISIALESCGIQDHHFVPACLLQTYMGGGSSFSSGGPGKGMYSRLYIDVLNQYHWVNSIVANNQSYSDTGLFTITGSAEPSDIESLVHVICKQIKSMRNINDNQEFLRAKCQLKSMLLMNLEMRPVLFEDIGRQVLYQGFRCSPDEWIQKIDKVNVEDMRDLVQRMMLSNPAMAGFGKIQKLPSLESVNKMLTTSERFIPRIFQKFS